MDDFPQSLREKIRFLRDAVRPDSEEYQDLSIILSEMDRSPESRIENFSNLLHRYAELDFGQMKRICFVEKPNEPTLPLETVRELVSIGK